MREAHSNTRNEHGRERVARTDPGVPASERSSAEAKPPDVRCSPGPTSSPGTSPTAATSPASTAISTPAARLWSSTENFADRSELGTEECFKVIDEIAAFAPECLTILTGGEPLLRRDILEIVRRASERELWVVVGTNGVRITENVARRLAEAGARGLSLSLDALDPDRHDRFRKVRGAWQKHGGGSGDPRTGPGSPSSCRRPRARTISASSKRSPTSRTIASPPRSGTSTSWCRPGAGSSCRTSPPRSTTRFSPRSTGFRGSTTAGCS